MQTIGKLNAAIYRNLQSILNHKLKDSSIQSSQYDFLYVITLNGGINQKELVEKLYIGKSTTVKAIKFLVSLNYVRKEKVINDKRVEKLYLTEKGKELIPMLKNTFEEIVELTTDNMDENEVNLSINLLKKILCNVQNKNRESEEMKLCWISLHVKDLNSSINFYNTLLGLNILNKISLYNGTEIVFLGELNEAKIELIYNKNNLEIQSKGLSIGFQVESLDEAYNKLKKYGAKILTEPFSPNEVSKFFFIEDLNEIEIQIVELLTK